MTRTSKRTLALLMALVQILTLLPLLTPSAEAVDAAPQTAQTAETPVLNELIVGEFAFQSFNFLGDNATGSDGVDYTSTFYYTDDWFSSSAINENAASTQMKWSDLENVSLAATSFDLTVAAYASNEGNVLRATTRTWDNTDYSDKAHNAREMLEQCGFTDFQAYSYDHAPTNDSIGFIIASKKIHVWDEYSQQNKDFTLLAVAVRGAGYGAEWASNVTIGDKSTNVLPQNGRHWGFDNAAQQVCAALQQYLVDHNITADAKYWITGFSRAGATANLVAGYVTDGAETIYHTHQRDVYGYTWECPQGAAMSENALNYKNIHNIINGMDAVPKVSPDSFQHQRLGVDYYMPYYKNTTAAQNETFYANMREVLKTIAVGAYNYKGEAYTEDPLIRITDPSQYPYNRTMRIRTITAGQLISDAIDGVLTDNFGTVDATGSDQRIPSQHIDEFIDDLIEVFMVSTVWDRHFSNSTSNILTHRTRFISYYQPHFRNVLGYLLDFTGPAFLGVIDQLLDAVGDQLALTNTVDNIGVGLAFLNFYNYPTSTYKWGVPPFIDPWVGSPSWVGQTRKDVLISEAQPVVRNVVNNLTSGFVDPQGITRAQFENSMDILVELVIDLYADELSRYNSNYFGTTLYYLWQILCTHEQEVVMSWIKSLDPMHMSRGYRTVTVPQNADVVLREFRAQYGETLSATGDAPVVAAFKDGAQVSCLDQRITMQADGTNMVIRYPASLDIRIDVTPDADYADLPFSVADYQTRTATTALSDGGAQYTRLADSGIYTDITNNAAKTNAAAVNNASAQYANPVSAADVFQILARGTTTYDNSGANDKNVYTLHKLVTASVVAEGQFRGETFYPDVTDPDGTAVDVAGQTVYTPVVGMNGLYNGVSVVLPSLTDGSAAVRYFVTDGSQPARLSSDTEPYLPVDTVEGATAGFTVAQADTMQTVLRSADTVWHVFYGGTFPDEPEPELKNGLYWEDGELWWYVDSVKTGAGLILVDGDYYYIKNNGMAVRGTEYYVTKTNGLKDRGVYTFDDTGKMIIPEVVIKNGLIWEEGKLWYYVDNVRTHAGLIYVDGYYYYVKSNGQAVTNSNYFVSNTNDLMPHATHHFDADGHMTDVPVIKNGLYPENGKLYYYVNDVKTHAGLIEVDGDYYYITSSCYAVAGCEYYVSNTHGLVDPGTYTFASDGKMIVPEPDTRTGIFEENGALYYYVDGVRTHAGLIEWEGHYYYIKSNCTAVRDCDYFVSNTNDLMPRGTYHFNADGTMVAP